MKVLLAGLNIDYDHIRKIKKLEKGEIEVKEIPDTKVFTPETLSAAYARISRSPLSIEKLRENSINKIDKARKSNKKIVYGMGHGSIAEHAVFNIDIINISRLASEFIQKHRLVSYTEKSQRYIKLEKDFIIPEEIKDNNDLVDEFTSLIQRENKLYNYFYDQLKIYFKNKYSELSKREVEGKAKEDSRYILSLATTSQMGMTINARNLEYMLKLFQANPLFEIQELGEKINGIVKDKVPSLIVFDEPKDYDYKNWRGRFEYDFNKSLEDNDYEHVKLIDYTENGEDQIVAGLVYQNSDYSFDNILKNINKIDKKEVLNKVFKGIDFYHSVDRAFELASAQFEFLLSSSAFAQLKRHRLSTILKGAYNINWSVTVPSSIEAIGEEEKFMDMIKKIEQFYRKVKTYDENAADYILTNSHRRKVIMKANMREWYHFIRLRADEHAQWEIRALAKRVEEKLKEIFPNVSEYLMGKDDFTEKFNKM